MARTGLCAGRSREWAPDRYGIRIATIGNGRGAGVMPFGTDALVIVLATRYGEMFWIFPPLVTVGSLAAAALTYWVGNRAGHAGLPRLVARHHLERIKSRLDSTSAGALAVAAVLPPPFPLTAFVLMCGALDLHRTRFFLVFGVMRLIRFGTVALLARLYGERVLHMLDSGRLPTAVVALVVLVCATTIASTIMLWRRTRTQTT